MRDGPQSEHDVGTIFRALAHRRRRLALGCLAEHQRLALPDLAESVAHRESDRRIDDLSGETVRDVYLALYHSHVPKLEAADLVSYDQATDTVKLEYHVDDVVRTVRSGIADIVDDCSRYDDR